MPSTPQPNPKVRDTGQNETSNINMDVQTNDTNQDLKESVENPSNNRYQVIKEEGVLSLQVDIEFKHELEYTEEKIYMTSLFHIHKLVSEWIKAKV